LEGVAANKNKIVALAQRYTVKGQFEKAIAEYRKLLKTDPQDIRTWLKVGDLYTRMGARKEATETYIRVAEQYTHAGFHLKAIAVYKQVLNLDPTLVVIHQYLAASYLELGLTSEALIQLEQLADVYERTQRNDLLLEVLLQMGKIDPHNIATRLRIAELLSKENRVMEASKHFAHACDELKIQGRKEDFVKVAERLLYHDPSRIDTALEVAAMYVERGQFKEALSKLQVCFVSNRKNVNVLELLAKSFLGLGQPEKAISVMTETAEILAGQGDLTRRKAVFQEILAIDPANETALAGPVLESRHPRR
jgi:pilus assembly protein FimV